MSQQTIELEKYLSFYGFDFNVIKCKSPNTNPGSSILPPANGFMPKNPLRRKPMSETNPKIPGRVPPRLKDRFGPGPGAGAGGDNGNNGNNINDNNKENEKPSIDSNHTHVKKQKLPTTKIDDWCDIFDAESSDPFCIRTREQV